MVAAAQGPDLFWLLEDRENESTAEQKKTIQSSASFIDGSGTEL
jgi:hypothetical protein